MADGALLVRVGVGCVASERARWGLGNGFSWVSPVVVSVKRICVIPSEREKCALQKLEKQIPHSVQEAASASHRDARLIGYLEDGALITTFTPIRFGPASKDEAP